MKVILIKVFQTFFYFFLVLMDMLLQNKMENPPQIIGLTASLGVGTTTTDINSCKKVRD